MSGLPLPAAAQALGVSEVTLRRMIARGAPVARRGRRGRGRATLVDPAAIAAWRGTAARDHASLIVFASELPELVAGAVREAFLHVEGPHKRATAGALAATWYVVVTTILDRLRRDAPDLRDPDDVPEQIDHLRSVFNDSGRTVRRDLPD